MFGLPSIRVRRSSGAAVATISGTAACSWSGCDLRTSRVRGDVRRRRLGRRCALWWTAVAIVASGLSAAHFLFAESIRHEASTQQRGVQSIVSLIDANDRIGGELNSLAASVVACRNYLPTDRSQAVLGVVVAAVAQHRGQVFLERIVFRDDYAMKPIGRLAAGNPSGDGNSHAGRTTRLELKLVAVHDQAISEFLESLRATSRWPRVELIDSRRKGTERGDVRLAEVACEW